MDALSMMARRRTSRFEMPWCPVWSSQTLLSFAWDSIDWQPSHEWEVLEKLCVKKKNVSLLCVCVCLHQRHGRYTFAIRGFSIRVSHVFFDVTEVFLIDRRRWHGITAGVILNSGLCISTTYLVLHPQCVCVWECYFVEKIMKERKKQEIKMSSVSVCMSLIIKLIDHGQRVGVCTREYSSQSLQRDRQRQW